MSSQSQTVETIIFDAAQSLLTNVGEDFTMEQLENKSGISRATIYRRVGNKEKLLTRLAAERGESFERTDIKMNILKAARIVFGFKGLMTATMEEIASEAGVGVATVYRHFGDKEGLMLAFIDTLTPRNQVREFALNPSDDITADLEKMVGAVLVFFFENRDIFKLVLVGTETEKQYLNSLRGRSDTSLERLTRYFAAQLKAGRVKKLAKADELALSLMGLVLSFAVIGPLHYDTELKNPEKTSKMLVDVFLTDLRGDNA